MSVNNLSYSTAEIQYNLSVMEKSVNSGKLVDAGFISIFQNAISELPDNEQGTLLNSVATIEKALNGLTHKTSHAALQTLINKGKSAGVQYPEPLNVVATKYESPINETLLSLSDDFMFRGIKGDGHCFFRALTAGALLSYQHLSLTQKEDTTTHIKNQVAALSDSPKYQQLKKLSDDFIADVLNVTPNNVESLLLNKKKTDKYVEFLRLLASEYNRVNPSDNLLLDLESENKNVNSYCNVMSSMSSRQYGGEHEISALSTALGIKIHAHDVQRAGETIYGDDNALATAHLLFKKSHYDLLVPKS